MMQPSLQSVPPDEADLELAVDDAIAACDGDARATIRALIVASSFHEAEVEALRTEMAEIVRSVSYGFTRGRFEQRE
jgi:hypothetical protein